MSAHKKPSLHLFETFLLVAEKLSITKAAAALGMTKSAISHAIKSLETELGVDLFTRSTRHIHLTEEGKLLYHQCTRLRTELETTRALVSQFEEKPQGTLTISCNPLLAETHLLPMIMTYKTQHPQMNINLLIEERQPDLASEQIDIVFGVNWPAPLDVVAKKMGTTRYVLCASPTYLTQFGTPTSTQDLANHHYIAHAGRKQPTQLIGLKKNNNAPTLNTTMMANNIQFMKQCVLNHLGIAQFHDYAIQTELTHGDLVELLPDHFNQHESLYVYYQKHQFVQPKIRQFIHLFESSRT